MKRVLQHTETQACLVEFCESYNLQASEGWSKIDTGMQSTMHTEQSDVCPPYTVEATSDCPSDNETPT